MATAPIFPGQPCLPAPTTTDLVALRFEDVTQDGRLVLEALPHALQPVWRVLAREPSFPAFQKQGIAPILTRLVLEGTGGPFLASGAATAEARYQIAQSGGGAIHLDMWSTLSAVRRGAPDARAPDGSRSTEVAGRVFAEHTFTRPFAPPGHRRVVAFGFDGAPEVRERRVVLPRPEALVTLPDRSQPLEPALQLDVATVTFGIVHTDSNKHVNSLVYLRIFEEAALRRFVALGRGSNVLGRRLEIAYRKPCFAGQRVRLALQAFERDGVLGLIGVLVDESQGQLSTPELVASARTYVRMGFEP
jgi:acyl-CoA thioesterase FadM